MKTRQARNVNRLLRRLGLLACASAIVVPMAFTFAQQVQVQVQVQEVAQPVEVQVELAPAQAVQIGPAGAVPAQQAAAKKDDKKEEKAPSVDPELEKEIAKLKKELEGLKKGTTDFDLKTAELGKKERELRTKVQLEARKKQQDQIVEQITSGLTLDTDSDVDMLLDRAREYATEGRYRDASVLWQHVLDQKPGLTDREPMQTAGTGAKSGAVLRPVRDLVEMELASLPAEGLAEYRIAADAEARAVLAASQVGSDVDRELEGLSEVVRRFFMSSLGDDAAYRLACIAMDEWDFISARRLLEKVTYAHPDPSMSRADLLLRLALVNAKAGDSAGAKLALKSLEEATSKSALPADLMAAVQRVVDAGVAVMAATGPVKGWPMALGGATRDGVMAGLPGKVVDGSALWIDQPMGEFDFKVPELVGKAQMMGTPQQGSQGRQEIVNRWAKGGWTPTAQVLLRDGKAFFKTHNELRWYDLKTRKLEDTVAQPSIKLESGARIWAQNYYYGNQQPDTPTSTEEIAMFGDRIAKSMSLIGDTLYHLEGRMWMGGPNARIMVWNRNKQSQLEVTERLCAVDVTDAGKGNRVKWRYPADEAAQSDLRFLAPPVPTTGDQLIVPVMRNGELFLTGIDAATGKERWNTLLGMPPNDDSSRWATVGVAAVGSEIYVATGYGTILAVDADAGSILWASRYKRSEPAGQQNRNFMFGVRGSVNLPGWTEDVIIPRGDKLVLLPSDADQVICFSRLTGKQIWYSPRENATYALGVLNDSLYVAGQNVVRRYSIVSGKLEKEVTLKVESHARGALTPQGVYLPTQGEIIRLDPKSLAIAGRLRVATNSQDPVGNLFCDGEHLVAAGLDRVYALSDGDVRLRELTDSIAKKENGGLRMERAFLYEVLGKTEASVEDLRVAFKLLPQSGKEFPVAGRKLMLGLLDLAQASPEKAEPLFDEAEKVAAPLKQQVRVWLARGRYHADRGESIKALDLYLKAAQDTSDALVLVDEDDGRREARASLAAGAEIRTLVTKLPDLNDELARRGEAALNPHLALAELERRMAEPGAALPQAGEIQKLETELAALSKESKAAQAKLTASDKERKQIEFQIGVEKTNPTGKLEALSKQLADLNAAAEPTKTASLSLDKAIDQKQSEVEAVRKQLAKELLQLNDLKANRLAHAERLLALGNLYAGSSVELKAHLLAARYLWNEDWFERSEMVLRELALSPNRSIAAAGSVALAQGYSVMKWNRQSYQQWARVAADFGNVAVEQGDRMISAGELASAALRAKDAPANPSQTIIRQMPLPPYEKLWSQTISGYYQLETNLEGASQYLEDHLLMLHTSSSKIICKNIESGQDLWHLSLARSNYSGSSTTNDRIVQFNNYNFPNGNLHRQGHIALLTSPDRVMAFSLTSGKKLWDVDTLPAPDRANRMNYYFGGASPMSAVAIGSGVVVEHGVGGDRSETQVRALDLHTGKVRWITEFKSDQITGLNAAHGYVYVFTNNGSQLVICDAATGQRMGRIKFENRQPQNPIEFTAKGLLVATMQKATFYELPTGKEKWSSNLTNRGNTVFSGYQRIERLDDHRVAILNGGLFMLDLRDGKEVGYVSAADMGGRYVNDMAISPDGKEILAIGYGNQNEQTISIIDAVNNKVKSNINLGPRIGQQVQASKVASSGDLLPVLINDLPKDLGGGRKQYTGKATVGIFRKADGQRIDIDKVGFADEGKLTNARSPVVRGDYLLITNGQTVTAYKRSDGSKPMELKPYDTSKDEDDAKKGSSIEVPNALPQILPGVGPGGARIIIQGGKIEINGKKIELKKKEEDKDQKKDEKADEKKDDKKGAAAGDGGKATVTIKATVVGGNGPAIIEIDGDTIILDAIGEAVEEAANQRAKESKDDQETKKEKK